MTPGQLGDTTRPPLSNTGGGEGVGVTVGGGALTGGVDTGVAVIVFTTLVRVAGVVP